MAHELYHTLIQTKDALRQGRAIPMTPVAESALHIIDPSFTIGQGALHQDAERGLRCPVRGCGRFYHQLSRHINLAHKSIGGAKTVKRVLSIPAKAALFSEKHRARLRVAIGELRDTGKMQHGSPHTPAKQKELQKGATQAAARRGKKTMGQRNWEMTCDAQTSLLIHQLHHKIGRTPSYSEFCNEYGKPLMAKLERLYGSWSAIIGSLGLEAVGKGNRPGYKLEFILPSFRAWYERHGDLPTSYEAVNPQRTPRIPTPQTVLRIMETSHWDDAMEQIAALLNIYGGRYGLPPRPSQDVAAD